MKVMRPTMCVFVFVCVKWQHRHVKCYKISRELSPKSCLILYQRKICEGQEVQTFRSNKYLLNQRTFSLVLCVLQEIKEIKP